MGHSIRIYVERSRVEAFCPECGNATKLDPQFEFVSVREKKRIARVRALCGSPALGPGELVTVSCDNCREVFLVKVEGLLEVKVRVFEVRERTEVVLTNAAEAERLKAERMDEDSVVHLDLSGALERRDAAARATKPYPERGILLPPGVEELDNSGAMVSTAEVRAFDPEKSVDPLRDRVAVARPKVGVAHFRITGSGGAECAPSCPACVLTRKELATELAAAESTPSVPPEKPETPRVEPYRDPEDRDRLDGGDGRPL